MVDGRPDVATLTAGGNDLLQLAFWGGDAARDDDLVAGPLRNLAEIARILRGTGCPVIMNTVYDPTDGQDALLKGSLWNRASGSRSMS